MKPDAAQLAALELRDIHAPGTPSLWPPAPGWWLLGLVLLGLLVAGGYLAWRRWQRWRWRQRLLGELDALHLEAADPGAGARLSAELSALLKRVALWRYPHEPVAELTGRAWLAFLDRTGGDGRFTTGPGHILEHGPYAPSAHYDAPALRALARDWLIKQLP